MGALQQQVLRRLFFFWGGGVRVGGEDGGI